jgi:hypothetical protein
MIDNPFVGPDPYRAAEQARFFGRDDAIHRLSETILGSRCLTLFGPAGAGKTSLLHAAVLPKLVTSQFARLVRVDAWSATEDPATQLVHALFKDLRLGDAPAGAPPGEAVVQAGKRAARASSRLVIVCLDQLEQILYPDHSVAAIESFLETIETLVGQPLRPVRLFLSLREDYLGPFLERLQGRLRLFDQYFRVGLLTAEDLAPILCRIAAAGTPPQQWSPEEMLPLLIEMRRPGQPAEPRAEVRLAYAQSFCRALFQRRAEGMVVEDAAIKRELSAYIERTVMEAEVTLPPEVLREEPKK